jgi:2-C-methyl-D-erythritol 2,4-cyclodiphosphate synthase
MIKNFRVGFGQDSHCFSKNSKRRLFLGGIEVDGENGLEANSDGDVVIHAICRAIEQALGNPDFDIYAGKMNKDGTDNSREYLKVALRNIKEEGYSINNLGISFECKRPNIFDLDRRIKESLSKIMKIETNQIGISATNGEDLSAFGRGEGIQVFAIVSLIKE